MSLSGLDKCWVFIRRNDCAYVTNKLLSFLLAAGLAVCTAMHKPLLQQYSHEYARMDNVGAYNYIYWLLFIYYSFQALDELIELYACMFKREKGSIGLLFELNYFLGIGIMGYLGYFYYRHMQTVPSQFKQLETFLEFQVTLLWVVLGITLMMFICMKCMHSKLHRKDDNKVNQGYKKADLDEYE